MIECKVFVGSRDVGGFGLGTGVRQCGLRVQSDREGKSRMVLIELAIVLACCGGCGLSACYPGR